VVKESSMKRKLVEKKTNNKLNAREV